MLKYAKAKRKLSCLPGLFSLEDIRKTTFLILLNSCITILTIQRGLCKKKRPEVPQRGADIRSDAEECDGQREWGRGWGGREQQVQA